MSYHENLDLQPVTPFRAVVERLQPGASGRQIAALVDNRITRHAALNYRQARRAAPQWVLDILAAKLRARTLDDLAAIERADKAPARLGLSAGAKNLAIYLQRKSRATKPGSE